jgi:hypothetical protein
MGLVTASFTLTWACAKEVNPPLLSGMSTSVTNMGGFLAAAILQPMVGWVMDWTWQGGLTESGARFYTPDDFHAGLLLLAGTAGPWGAGFVADTGNGLPEHLAAARLIVRYKPPGLARGCRKDWLRQLFDRTEAAAHPTVNAFHRPVRRAACCDGRLRYRTSVCCFARCRPAGGESGFSPHPASAAVR